MTIEVAAGILLIVVPVAFNVAFFALGRAFDYPAILRKEPDEILRRFADGGSGLLLRWELLLISALAMLPLAAVLAVALAAPPVWSVLAVVLGASAALSRRIAASTSDRPISTLRRAGRSRARSTTPTMRCRRSGPRSRRPSSRHARTDP